MRLGKHISKFPFLVKAPLLMFALFGVAAAGVKGVSASTSSINQKISDGNIDRIVELSEKHPKKFTSFDMTTLKCTSGSPGLFITPIDCYVNNKDGSEFHLSNKRLHELSKG
jgi:hypothetical protein